MVKNGEMYDFDMSTKDENCGPKKELLVDLDIQGKCPLYKKPEKTKKKVYVHTNKGDIKTYEMDEDKLKEISGNANKNSD